VDLGCGGASSINDWNGRFHIQWGCLPREFGEFNTTITVKNATTLTMIDDGDTPAEAYEASMVGTSPRAIRGFFLDGPTGSRYREDFSWSLNLDGNGFAQISRYSYIEGPQTGRGGICAAPRDADLVILALLMRPEPSHRCGRLLRTDRGTSLAAD
jgi:hypothetical protein